MTETEMYKFVETFTNPDQIQSYLNDINPNDGYEYIAIKLSSNLFSIYRKPKKGKHMTIKFKKLDPNAVEPKKQRGIFQNDDNPEFPYRGCMDRDYR